MTFREIKQTPSNRDREEHERLGSPLSRRAGRTDGPFLALLPGRAEGGEAEGATRTGVSETLVERPSRLDPATITWKREGTYRRLLAFADALSASAVVVVAAVLAQVGIRLPTALVPLLAVVVSKILGLYDRDDMVIRKSTLDEWRTVLQGSLFTGIGMYVGWHLLTTSDRERSLRLLVFLVFGTFLASIIARTLARAAAARICPPERCAVVGNPEECEALATGLAELKGVEMVGLISNAGFSASVSDVRDVVERLDVHRVVIGPYAPWREAHTLELIRTLKWLGVRVTLMPSFMAVVGEATVVDAIDGTVLLGVPAFGLSRSSQLIKRCFDMVGGAIASAVLVVPAAVIAVAVKLDTPGPVIFKQTRIGRDGKPFTMYKFRSMVPDAEQLKADLHHRNEAANGLFKMEDDPRVTRVGRVLRKTYLDEIPQLVNILRGEMSLVGPRPLIRSEDMLLTGSDRHRLVLMPGLTGPWQLRGPLQASLPELAKLDYLYASNWSVWRDVDIILGTVSRIFRRHGH